MTAPPGLIVAAPASGSGKTLVTLALLRALRDRGGRVVSFKVGPDYIDPAFHAAATGTPCLNVDAWAMRPATIARVLDRLRGEGELVIAEGVMGLFDGAETGAGSTAEVATTLGWPVVLVVDARGMARSAAAVLSGFAGFDPHVRMAGVIFNRVGGPGHARLLRAAAAEVAVPVLGCLPRAEALSVPSRHLGLVQAVEHADLEAFLTQASAWIAEHLDLDALAACARPSGMAESVGGPPLPPPGQRIAVASDAAFAFAYPLILDGWREAGAEIVAFSPLADEAPDAYADAVYLPGGYPELHAGRLAGNARFLKGLRDAARRGAEIYGECGGYMVLGEGLTDGEGRDHAMAGLLPLATSFAARQLTLGYREAVAMGGFLAERRLRGHEFHFATVAREGPGEPAFKAWDSTGRSLGTMGLRAGRVWGSFLHLVDAA